VKMISTTYLLPVASPNIRIRVLLHSLPRNESLALRCQLPNAVIRIMLKIVLHGVNFEIPISVSNLHTMASMKADIP
jgi:hypothetical protein